MEGVKYCPIIVDVHRCYICYGATDAELFSVIISILYQGRSFMELLLSSGISNS